MVNLGCKDK